MTSIFRKPSLDRAFDRWDLYLHSKTPWEQLGGVWLKREDYFAPLGYGGINGSKLRQCIWLTTEYIDSVKRDLPGRGVIFGGKLGMLSAASVKSPQLSMGALVAKHFELPCKLVLGATTLESAVKHENVAIAHAAGAEFYFTRVAYNPALQRVAAELHQRPAYASYMRLEYGITVPEGDDKRIEAFHRLGSEQVKNLPKQVTTLFVPMGSANSCTSILYGIARFRPKTLKRVVLIGIGPTRLDWLNLRLAAIERVSGLCIRPLFHRSYAHHPDVSDLHNNMNRELRAYAPGSAAGVYDLEHHDLHSTGYVSYQDEMPYDFHGVELHPTYEGKVLTYLKEKARESSGRATARPGSGLSARSRGSRPWHHTFSKPSGLSSEHVRVRTRLGGTPRRKQRRRTSALLLPEVRVLGLEDYPYPSGPGEVRLQGRASARLPKPGCVQPPA